MARRLLVGDEVVFGEGANQRRAVIVEDRGKLGVGGTRIYRIALLPRADGDDAVEFELAESLLERAKARSRQRTRRSPTTA
jgi:hypothetical protein